MTFHDVEKLANRGLAAADLLLANGFHNQAVARAYYAVYALVSYTANHTPAFMWPVWPQATTGGPINVKIGRLQHRHMHTYTETIYGFAGRPPINLIKAASPRHAVKELYQQRITADYLSPIEIGPKMAKRLVGNAKEIVRVMMGEATKVQGNPTHLVK